MPEYDKTPPPHTHALHCSHWSCLCSLSLTGSQGSWVQFLALEGECCLVVKAGACPGNQDSWVLPLPLGGVKGLMGESRECPGRQVLFLALKGSAVQWLKGGRVLGAGFLCYICGYGGSIVVRARNGKTLQPVFMPSLGRPCASLQGKSSQGCWVCQ